MYAGQTLAQLALAQVTDPAGVLAELQARVARGGKSAKNASKAIERMTAGVSVAIPAPAPKAPKASATAQAQVAQARTNLGLAPKNPNSPIIAQNARAKGVVTIAQAYALVAAEGRAAGYSIPRWVSAGAKGKSPRIRTQA